MDSSTIKRFKKSLSAPLTFMVAPGASGETRQWRIKAGVIYAIALLGFAFLAGNVFFSASAVEERMAKAEINRLKSENAALTKKYETLRWDLSDLKTRYDELVEKEIAIRQMFDLPEIDPEQRMLGTGGPGPVVTTTLTESERTAYRTEAEVDRLNTLARFEVSKFDEILDALSEKKTVLDHTPSIMPTDGWLSRGMGMKPNPFTGIEQFHAGIDLANHHGTPVRATANGVVKIAARNGGMGKMIMINHGNGIVTRYGHLEKILVRPGERVKRGDVIGQMGSTGYSTGPHLHYEVLKNGKAVNPFNYIITQNY